MTDLADYLPQPTSWFSETVTYKGIGYIEFSNPRGWVKGPMTCEVSRIGDTTATIEIEEWENSEAPNDVSFSSQSWLLSGIQMRQISSAMEIGSGATNNIVEFVRLQNPEGELTSERVVYYQRRENSLMLSLDIATYLTNGQLKTNSKYWILPCINFKPAHTFGAISAHQYINLREHPLRVLITNKKTQEFLASDAPQNERN